MASGAPGGALTLEGLAALASSPGAAKVLPPLVWAQTVEEEDLRFLVHLVRCRNQGFMVCLAPGDATTAALEAMSENDPPMDVLYQGFNLALEDARGRRFGTGDVLLADFPAEALGAFTKPSSLRGAAAVGLIRINVDGTVARPAARSAWAASDEWIKDAGDVDDSLQEYITGESGGEQPNGVGGDAEVVMQLQSRIADLEQALAAAPSRPPTMPVVGEPQPQVRHPTYLFQPAGQPGAVDPSVMAQLRAMAGPPPVRLSRLEKEAAQMPATPAQNLRVEADAELIDEEEVAAAVGRSSDPLHQLLALQMRQTAALASRLTAKQPVDRITAALGNDSAQSSNGVKGCVAREAYLKTMEDIQLTGKQIMANAAADMGLAPSQIHSGLMREYLERRMPLGDHRLLSHFGQFLAVGWQWSFEQNNEMAMGLMARGLMMVEQIAIDQGRVQFAWLLSAMPDPNLQTIALNKRRIGLRPYAKLAAAPWIAGNIAFLKDLDYLENRLKVAKPTEDKEDGEDPKKKWKKNKKGQKPDASDPSTS